MLKRLAALVLPVVVTAALAACQPNARTLEPTQGDAFLGPADAKVVVVEYGAPSCPACKSWHDQAWAKIKTDYIDTGKIKFVFRELPSHNPPVDAAVAGIARCIGGTGYFDVIDEAFARQSAIDNASHGPEGPRAQLIALGQAVGLSAEQTQACISDPTLAKRVFEVQDMADRAGVNGTPTFFINDRMVNDPRPAAFTAAIDAAIAAAGGATP